MGMTIQKRAKIINALSAICEKQDVSINDLVEQLIGVCFGEEEGRELVAYWEEQNS
tara:strand:+ start:2807 stop:2974 length:168 start_codon:yes stop_codon:yes gene_type:complete